MCQTQWQIFEIQQGIAQTHPRLEVQSKNVQINEIILGDERMEVIRGSMTREKPGRQVSAAHEGPSEPS